LLNWILVKLSENKVHLGQDIDIVEQSFLSKETMRQQQQN